MNKQNDNVDVFKLDVTYHTPVNLYGDRVGVIGIVNGDNCYVSHRKRREHYYRKESGYAVSTKVLDHLTERDINRVFINETDTNRVYEYDLADFLSGTLIDHEDHDQQRVAPVEEAEKLPENTL